MVLGGLLSLILYVIDLYKQSNQHVVQDNRKGKDNDAYEKLRQHLGESILLGLEVLIIGDIVRTIVVDTTIQSVAVLGTIVIIRIILSFSLELEMYGTWPWNRAYFNKLEGQSPSSPQVYQTVDEHSPLLAKPL